MAWWNNPAGGQTPEVSLERVAAWFDAQGFAYELTEDDPGLVTSFGRYSYVIEVLDDIMATHARFWTNLSMTTGTRWPPRSPCSSRRASTTTSSTTP